MLWLLVGLAIGLQLGWYARTIRDLLRLLIREVRSRQEQVQERKQDDSGVILGNTPYQRGKIIDLPPHVEGGNIVRSPTPQQVKAQQQRAHEQDLMNL